MRGTALVKGLMMNFCSSSAFRIYGGLMFISGIVTSLVTFEPGE